MDSITQFDGNLLIGIQQALNADWLTPIMKAITFTGENGWLVITLCVLMMLFKKTRRLGIICFSALAFCFLCTNIIIKPLVDRTRPWVTFEEVHAMLPPPGDASFPSGHAANTMAAAWAMFIVTMPVKTKVSGTDGRLRSVKSYDDVTCLGWKGCGADPAVTHTLSVILVILAVLVGFSRLYLGMHYPTDVVCGLLIGMICATVVYSAFLAAERKRGVLGAIKTEADQSQSGSGQ